VIHSFHGHHLYDPEFGLVKRSILNLIERLLAPRAQRLVTVGKKVGEELLAVGIGKPEQYLSIPPGISAIELGSDSAIRKKFGFSEDEVLILWLGRFTQVKRPDRVIEIARLMPGARFIMAGGGEMLEELKQSAPSNLTFLGYQDKNQMWTIADIALCTSDSEGMPLSLIEAQMAGVPVVSTDVGSVAEIVEDGVTGRLAMRSIEDLAAKLLEVMGEIEKSDALSKASQRRAAKEFTVKVMAEAHLDLYKKVLDKVAR
jgi:glycosyltransferase involved in cell wall biosynthesis